MRLPQQERDHFGDVFEVHHPANDPIGTGIERRRVAAWPYVSPRDDERHSSEVRITASRSTEGQAIIVRVQPTLDDDHARYAPLTQRLFDVGDWQVAEKPALLLREALEQQVLVILEVGPDVQDRW